MIFVDTGAFLARYVAADDLHEEANRCWDRIAKGKEAIFTSNFVLDETFTLLGHRAGYAFSGERAENIYASKAITILRPDRDDELAATKWFKRYAAERVSFTDCVSFVLMRRFKMTRVFAFDHHFSLAGFTLVP